MTTDLKKNTFIHKVVSILAYISAGTCFGLGAFSLLLIGFFHTGAFFEWWLKKMCKGIIFFAGIRLQAEGLENSDPEKQYIIMMNHVNIFDGFLFYARYPGKARGVEEESHFSWLIYGWLLKRIGFIPINRKSGIRAMSALKKAGELIRERKNFSVTILPEGTRTRSGKLGNFKKGGFLLALESGLEILPIIQVGAFQVKRKGCWIIRPGKVRYIIEKPISTDGYTKENIQELMNTTRQCFLKYVE